MAYFSYTETLTPNHGLHDGEICFTLMNVVFKRPWQIKGFGELLGSLQLLLRPGIKPGPHWPEANALTTTL